MKWSICLALAALTFFVFLPALENDFVAFDDPAYLTENLQVQRGLSLEGVKWAFTTTHASNWHPITWLSHMLDMQLFGPDPGAHHGMSIALHTINTIMLFLVLSSMTAAIGRSAVVAALFAIHPLHVESVAWAAERKDVLSTFFLMLELICYRHYLRTRTVTRYLLVIIVFALGLMAKPMLVTLPVLLILLDYWPLGRFQKEGPPGQAVLISSRVSVFLEKAPLLALSALSSVITLAAQSRSGTVASLERLSFFNRLGNSLASYLNYVLKMLWPSGLAFYYPLSETPPWWNIITAAIFVVFVTVISIRMRRTSPFLFVGWFWYLFTLAPVIGIVQVGAQAMADRYTYIPLIGLFIVLSWSVWAGMSKLRQGRVFTFALFVVAILLLGAVSRRSVSYWRNSITLFSHALEVTERNWMAEYNLARVYQDSRQFEQALLHYQRALKVKPNYWKGHLNMGVISYEQGNINDAIPRFHKARSLRPDQPEPAFNLGMSFARLGRHEEAASYFALALRADPTYDRALEKLGESFLLLNRADEALTVFSSFTEKHPASAIGHYNLGRSLLLLGREQEAARHFQQAHSLDPALDVPENP